MSSPDRLTSSQNTFVNTFSSPVRALQVGIRHAYQAAEYLGKNKAPGFDTPYPKKQKLMAPIPRGQKKLTMKRKTTYKKKVSFPNKVKKTILSMAETYHRGINDSSLNGPLLHSNLYTYNLTAQVQQGTSLAQRQGDAIYLMGVNIRGSIFAPTTAGAYQYRIMVVRSGKETNPATLLAGIGAADVFLPNTYSTFTINGQINSKALTLLYDQTVDVNSQLTATADVAQVNISIPIYKKFEYQSDGAVYGKKDNVYVLVTAIVAGGTAGTTSCGQFLGSADVIFKNL